jgi:hypothetical protein
MELEAVRYFTDSAVALGMILQESATYQEFVGTRVSEIRTKSEPETEWFWIPGEMNIADMGTRLTVVPKDMGPGTPYQEGMPWMREPPETWPAKKTFAPPPPEECKKDMMAMVMTTRVKPGLWYPPSADTRTKLERVYGYVYTFLAGARKLTNFRPVTRRLRTAGKETGATYGPPAEQYREAARLCLLRDAQAGIEKSGLKGLAVEDRTYSVEGFADKEILTLGGRQKNYLRIAYDRGDLPPTGAPPPVQTILGGGPQDGSCLSRRNGHEEPGPGVDHTSPPESQGREERVLRVQEISQEVGGAEDGTPA